MTLKPVRLQDRRGAMVAELELPSFPQVPPEAVRWGERMFLRVSAHLYREAFVYVVPARTWLEGAYGGAA